MSNAIGDLLPKDRFQEPPEVRLIKNYVQEHFQQTCVVTVQPRQLIISVKGAALAGALRMHAHSLQDILGDDKKLVIRIS